jgi:hypothetical protein
MNKYLLASAGGVSYLCLLAGLSPVKAQIVASNAASESVK